MPLQRSLHFVSAFLLVTGTLAVTDSVASAMTPPASVPRTQPAALPAVVAPATDNAVRAQPSVGVASPSVRREVFGFGLASSLGDPTYGYPSWNFSLLSTVAFFGLHINWDGTIVSDSGLNVWNSSTLTGLLTTAHASGTKVVLTIVLQDFAAGTPNMCAGLINRSVTVTQAVAQVTAKGVDGLNVDYEGLNGTCQNGETAQAMMTDFVRQLRGALPSGSYLSVDTYASSAADSLGFFDIPGLNAYADSFFVMAYDLEYSNYHYAPLNCVSFCLGPTAPLAGYHYNDTTTASQYAAVVSASKVILGVPYYGRKACVGAAVPNAYPSSSVSADSYLDASGESTAPGVSSYATHRDANDPNGQERWDTWFNSSMNCMRELYWDDATALGAKYDLVNADNLRGVGIWTLNYGGGAPELWAALSGHFVACTAVSLATSPPSQTALGTRVTVTATASGCPDPNPLYQFWILKPGASAWQMVQAYSTSPTWQWNTGGATAGTYSVAVWARDANSTGTSGNSIGRWDAFASAQYTLSSSACSSVAISSGTGATITARASGCPNPLYEFWILAPGASSWQMVQAYSTSATWQWNISGVTAGTYLVAVWAKDSNSTGTSGNSFGRWDAFSSMQYTYAPPCSAATLASSPQATAPAGTVVTVSAHASGCASPLYQFWILKPGAGSWSMGQAYSISPTWQWNTSGATAGTYSVAVWAKDSNSTGTSGNSIGRWDAFSSMPYTLGSSACSSATISSAAVTITAHASGCPNPLYEFWILAPGAASWQMVQAYSSSPTWQWNVSGAAAGTYFVAVWARDSNSTGTSGNNIGRWDAFSSMQYIYAPPCSAATLASSPPAAAPVGTVVNVTAHAFGCANPLYQFWILKPGASSWQMGQAYSTGPTWQWSTSGATAGTYSVAVWAKDSSSTGTSGNSIGRWDAFTSMQYTLSSSACSSATVSSAPVNSATVGTSVTITAHASGCPNPLYEFWILAPGATSWKMVQAYSTAPTWQWNTSGAAKGTYVVAVWAKDSNSTGNSGNAFGRWDSFAATNYTLS